jgi:Glycosyltransferase family 87
MDRRLTVAIVVLILTGLAWQIGGVRRTDFCAADFPAFYAGGQMVGTPELYSPEAIFAANVRDAGCAGPAAAFVRPPFYAVMLAPLGWLPFHTAWVAFIALNIAALVGYVFLWPGNRLLLVLALAWSYPIGYSFASGKDIQFVLIWLALAVALMVRGYETAAGLVLALCSIKFHLFLLIPLWIVCARLWRVAQGLAIGSGALLAVSFLAAGWNWPSLYLRVLRDPRIDPSGPGGPQRALINLMAHTPTTALSLEIAIGVGIVLAVTLVSRRAPAQVGLAAALIGGVLINRHVATSDLALLISAGFSIVRYAKADWTTPLILLLLSPVPYLSGSPPAFLAMVEIVLLGGLAYIYARPEAGGGSQQSPAIRCRECSDVPDAE